MSSSFGLAVPFLRTQRKFPQDSVLLEKELTNMYIETAMAVNARVIGVYNTQPINTGELWYPTTTLPGGDSPNIRPTYRQVYPFGAINTGTTLTFAHNIPVIVALTHAYGTIVTGNPDFRPLPYVDTINVTNQVSLIVNATNIIITNGATAPNITSGLVILEWLAS